MAKFKFYLKNKNANTETPIILFCIWNNQILKHYPGLKTKPQLWDSKSGRFKKVSENPNYKPLNNQLTNIENAIETIFIDLESSLGRFPDKIELSLAINQEIKPDKEKSKKKCDNLYDYGITNCEMLKNQLIANGEIINKDSVHLNHIQTLKVLMQFVANKKYLLDFDNIDKALYSSSNSTYPQVGFSCFVGQKL